MAGGMHGGGDHAWRGGMHGGGHVWQRGVRSRRDGHCSGRYASYWNAFLFQQEFITGKIFFLLTGTVAKRGHQPYTIQNGNVDDTSKILRFTHDYMPEYQGNVASDKSVSGWHVCCGFTLSYRPSNRK